MDLGFHTGLLSKGAVSRSGLWVTAQTSNTREMPAGLASAARKPHELSDLVTSLLRCFGSSCHAAQRP